MQDFAGDLGFYLFAIVSIIGALIAVRSTRILRAAIGLATTLVAAAALYAILGSGFLAAIQILIYVGGIVVLIVFAVMLTSSNEILEPQPTLQRQFLAVASGLLFMFASITVLSSSQFSFATKQQAESSDAAALGRLMLDGGGSGYLIAFEAISLLLLAAVIGAIVVARSEKPADGQVTENGEVSL